MPITLFLVKLLAFLFMLLLFTGWQWVANALVWVGLGGFVVFLLEALGTLNGAANFFFGKRPKS